MASLGTLAVNLVANSGKFRKGIGDAEKRLNKFSQSAKRAVAGVGALAAGYLSARAVGGAIESARTQIQAEQKLQAVLASTGGAAGLTAEEIKAYAGELQKMTNFGDEATINAAAMLATFKEIKGDAFKDTLAVAQDMSAVLGTDLKGSVIQLGKALNDPAKGLSALSRSGVSFTESQKQQIKALQESGDLLGAQKIILSELQSEFGGAAAAMADPWTQLQNMLGDVGEQIGLIGIDILKSVIPPIQKLATLIGNVTTYFRTGIGFIGKWAVKLGAVAAVIYGVVKAVLVFRTALVAVRAAQIAMLAMAGPAGWGAIAIGIGFAVAGVATLDAALADTADTAKELQQAIPSGGGGGGGGGGEQFEPVIVKQWRDVEQLMLSIRKPRKNDDVREFNKEMDTLAEKLRKADLLYDVFADETLNFGMSLKNQVQEIRAEASGFNGVLEDAKQTLSDLENNVSKSQKEANKFRAMGLDQSQVDQLLEVRKHIDAINKQREMEKKHAKDQERNQASFNKRLEDTQNRLRKQQGIVSDIDLMIEKERKLGIDEKSLSKLRKALQKEQNLIAQQKSDEEWEAHKKKEADDIDAKVRENIQLEKEAGKRRADGGTFGSAKAAQTILNATKQTPMVMQQKLTNKMLAKIQLTLKKQREESAVQGAVA